MKDGFKLILVIMMIASLVIVPLVLTISVIEVGSDVTVPKFDKGQEVVAVGKVKGIVLEQINYTGASRIKDHTSDYVVLLEGGVKHEFDEEDLQAK
jgi:hypothetical protein